MPQWEPPALEPNVVQGDALFGFSMAMGKVGLLNDAEDDVVISAPRYDDLTNVNTGASFPFVGQTLTPHVPYDRVFPADSRDDIQMGRTRVTIGDVRGGQSNLVFVGGPFRDRRFPQCVPTGFVNQLGGVDVLDLNAPGSANATLLIPPGDEAIPPEVTLCYPYNTKFFGHSLAIGDIDGDSINDLVVGAHGSTNAVGAAKGRVYILFGHPTFVTDPWRRWLVLASPGPSGHENFGVSVTTADLDFDGKVEVIIGNNERGQNMPNVGRVFIVSGDWISQQAPVPYSPVPPIVPPGSAFQEIVNPLAESEDSFGWQVFALGDVGNGAGNIANPPPPDFDGRPDIGIHAEGADYPGDPSPGAPCPNPANLAGALFVFYGSVYPGDPLGPPYVDVVDPLAIYTPSSVGCPQGQNLPTQTAGRTGRAAAVVEWLGTDDQTSEETTAKFLLVSEPERNIVPTGGPGFTHKSAGQVYMLGLPIWEGNKNQHLLSTPIRDPSGITTDALFGSWIVTGDYKADPVGFPGQQIVISARQFTNQGLTLAGRAYKFIP